MIKKYSWLLSNSLTPRVLIRTIRQNRLPFLMLTLCFVFFLATIMYAGRLIYTMEADTLRAQVAGALNNDVGKVKEFFSTSQGDFMFIRNVPGLREWLAPGAGRPEQKIRAENMLLMFAKSHPRYSRIRLIDRKGMETLSLYRGEGATPSVAPGALLRDRTSSDYYVRTMGRGRDGLYASFFSSDYQGESPPPGQAEPAVMLASTVYDGAGGKQGMIVLEISLRELLGQLSAGTFFQDDRGQLVALQRDGSLLKDRSSYIFEGSSGAVSLSDAESVPYVLVEYVPGFKIWMARRFSVSAVKESMVKLEVASVSVLVVFFLSVLVLGFLNLRHFRNVDMAQKAIIHSLANLSEWRDPETGTHLERTRNFSVLLAKTLGSNPKFRKTITNDFIEALYDAVPLHDIGKVAIRDDILLKAARLSSEEFAVMKNHVMVGRDIIRDIIVRFRIDNRFLQVSENICHFHHEKYDGTGYPNGLKGDEIPLEARIFAVCDVYDALRAKRPYKPGLSHEEAVGTILPDRGRHFDPDVVDAFVECSDRFYEMFELYSLFDNTYGKLMNLRSSDSLKIEWSADLAVGNKAIDSQHREFIKRVNALFTGVLLGEGKRETLRAVEFLNEYASHHFSSEEALMEKCRVPGLELHKSEHATFLRNLSLVRESIKRDDNISSALVVEINAKVVSWIVTHIIRVDREIGPHLGAEGSAETRYVG